MDPEAERAAEAGTVAGVAATVADAVATMANAADQVVDQGLSIRGYTTTLGRCIPQFFPLFFNFQEKLILKTFLFCCFFER